MTQESYFYQIQGITEKKKLLKVIVAPEDLPEILTYNDAVKTVANLKNWHGFDGENFANDKDLFKAIKSKSYNGGWFIPAKDLLINIFEYRKEIGKFKCASHSDFADWYWSSSEHRDGPDYVWNVRFSDGAADWDPKVHYRLRCRPVRLAD